MTKAYFTWTKNRIGQVSPHLCFEHRPISGPVLEVLSVHEVETDDPYSLKLDELAEKYPMPQEESQEVYK
jgi:hypothetical protein